MTIANLRVEKNKMHQRIAQLEAKAADLASIMENNPVQVLTPDGWEQSCLVVTQDEWYDVMYDLDYLYDSLDAIESCIIEEEMFS